MGSMFQDGGFGGQRQMSRKQQRSAQKAEDDLFKNAMKAFNQADKVCLVCAFRVCLHACMRARLRAHERDRGGERRKGREGERERSREGGREEERARTHAHTPTNVRIPRMTTFTVR